MPTMPTHHLFDYYPQKVTEYQLRKDAEAFGISTAAAVKMQIRYAQQAVEMWADILEPIAWRWFDVIVKLKEIEARLNKPRVQTITDQMIEQAREYPVDQLIEFQLLI